MERPEGKGETPLNPGVSSATQVSPDGVPVLLANRPDNFLGGKIRKFAALWATYSSDPQYIKFVMGNFIEFVDSPPLCSGPRTLRLGHLEQAALDCTIKEFIEFGIVEQCAPTSGPAFYSNYFPVMKPDGSARFILNLEQFNLSIQYRKFKMDSMKEVIQLIFPNCFFAKVDFKHAYYSVHVQPQDRDWFRFLWCGLHFRFTCLPQGFTSAPRVFSKLLKPIFSHFRSLGIICLCYLDDCIFLASSAEALRLDLDYVIGILDSLGLTISVSKCCLAPSRRIEFLGFNLDSVSMTVQLTEGKRQRIQEFGSQLVSEVTVSIRRLSSFIGSVVAADHGVPRAPLKYKYLEVLKNRALVACKGNFDGSVTLDPKALGLVGWWVENVHRLSRLIVVPQVGFELVTDAATSLGWGAHVGTSGTYGHWSVVEKDSHCNVLELQAILYGLQSLCGDAAGSHVRIRSDNTTAVACVNRCGSIKESLLDLCVQIFDWAEEREIYLSAAHVKGSDNVEADRLSRIENVDTEWSISQPLFDRLCVIFGRPSVDLFASRINYKLACFLSWHPDPSAVATDAFAFSWSDFYGYAFPPFSVLGRVIQKIIRDRATVLLIMPLWPSRPWFPLALQLLIANPLILSKGSLYLPQDPARRHRLDSSLALGVLMLSGNPSRQGAFRRQLRSSSFSPGGVGPRPSIGHISRGGVSFVSDGKSVCFTPL